MQQQYLPEDVKCESHISECPDLPNKSACTHTCTYCDVCHLEYTSGQRSYYGTGQRCRNKYPRILYYVGNIHFFILPSKKRKIGQKRLITAKDERL